MAQRRVDVDALSVGRVAVIGPELHEARRPAGMGRARDRFRLLVRVGDDDLAVDADARRLDVRVETPRIVAMLRPDGSILLDEGAIRRRRAESDQVHVPRCGPGHALDVARRAPERRIRTLERRQLHRHVVIAIVLPTVGQARAGHPRDEHVERLLEHGPRACRIEAVIADLVRRHAAADTELEPAAAQVIEHADLAQQSKRRVQRQEEDERPQPNAPRALGRRGQEHRRRGRHPERCGVMLGQVIAEKARRVRLLQEPQPILVELPERPLLPAIDPVEHSELYVRHYPLRALWFGILASAGAGVWISSRGRPRCACLAPGGSGSCSR